SGGRVGERAREAGAKKGIYHQCIGPNVGQGLGAKCLDGNDFGQHVVVVLVVVGVVRGGQQSQPHGVAGLVEHAGQGEAVAAVVAGAAEQQHRERIIIINEAHHVPRHRAFTAALLPGLAAQGYHYLAAEDLLEDDSLNWATRRYPVQATGSLVGEPNMANLLRIAQKEGYQLRSYNYGFSREGDWQARQKAREIAQA
nr:hypothetical protein [Tanacetum cinerariifolium]